MKRLFLTVFVAFFSTFSAHANLEDTLDLRFGIESYQANIIEIEDFSFTDASLQGSYERTKQIDAALRAELLRLYRSEEITYYKVSRAIENHRRFVYHTNEMFRNLQMLNTRGFLQEDAEFQQQIETNYQMMRAYYTKVRNNLR